MNVFRHCLILCVLAMGFVTSLERISAQTQVVSTLQSIQVTHKTTTQGQAYVFLTKTPPLAKTWSLSIAEHNGLPIFSDTGQNWNEFEYEWLPDPLTIHSGIFYIVTVSFISEKGHVLSTKSSKFFTTIEIHNNRTPLIFFRGNTVMYSTSLYNEDSGRVKGILDFIANQSNNKYKEHSILVRGHAAFTTRTVEERQKEQIELLALSNKRALKIIEELTKRNVSSERITYEVLGGSEELSKNPRQLWKNRRVEIIFMLQERTAYMTEKNKTIDKPVQTRIEQTTTITPPIISKTPDTQTRPIIRQEPITIVREKETPITSPHDNSEIAPWPDTPIISKGFLTSNELAAFVLYQVPALDTEYVQDIASMYILEALRENVNQDIAFAQMLLETNHLQFTENIHKNQYNFASIGTVNNRDKGNWFSTEQIGIRAHIQHLKGYATQKPLQGNLVDPRYPVLEYSGLLGSAPLVGALSGRWSEETDYGTRILRMMRRMYNFAEAWRATSQ